MSNGGNLLTVQGAGSTVISGSINGGGSLTKVGTGTLTLGGYNTYGGTTNINLGTLSLANSGAIPGNITFGGGTLQFTTGNTTDYSNNIVNSPAAISIDTNGLSVTFSGNLAGSNIGGLTKNGSGTLSLSGTNTYSGSTTISNGVLSVGSLDYVASGSWTNHGAWSNLGLAPSPATGTINLGSGSNTGVLSYTGSGEATDRVINLNGTTGGATIDQSGSGLLEFTAPYSHDQRGQDLHAAGFDIRHRPTRRRDRQ